MNHLIDRLRWCEKYGKRHVGELCGEAADEIERLKAALEWVGATTDSPKIALYCHKALEGEK